MSEQQQEQKNKEASKFDINYKSLVALLTGENLLRKSRIPIDDVAAAMAELVKDKKEAAIKTIKEDVTVLVDSYIAFQKFKREQEKAYEKVLEEKQKEFNIKAQSVFSKIDDLKSLERTYYDALAGASTPAAREGQIQSPPIED